MANHSPWVKIRVKYENLPLIDMTPEEAEQVQAHIRAIAAILYKNTPASELTSLESIEKSVRRQMLEHVSPNVALFLSSKLLESNEAKLDS